MADETSTSERADTAAPAVPVPGIGLPPPRLLRWEIVTVFAVSLGASGVYALVQYIGSLTAQQARRRQADAGDRDRRSGRIRPRARRGLVSHGYSVSPRLADAWPGEASLLRIARDRASY